MKKHVLALSLLSLMIGGVVIPSLFTLLIPYHVFPFCGVAISENRWDLSSPVQTLKTTSEGNNKRQITESPNPRPPRTPHASIDILGDDIFHLTAMAESWPGNGSLADPYIIENYDISVTPPLPEGSGCISIRNCWDVHFIIRGCLLEGSTETGYAGIYLQDTRYAQVRNNIIRNNYYGIYVGTAVGFTIGQSEINLIEKNQIESNAVDGIHLWNISETTIVGNTIHDNKNGIFATTTNLSTIEDNICFSNDLDGIAFYSSDSNSLDNNTYTSNGDDGIQLNYSPTNSVSQNNCSENLGHGLNIMFSDENELQDNTCVMNQLMGINLYFSMTNTLHNETCNLNQYHGLNVIHSNNSHIANATCNQNLFSGIYLLFSYNTGISQSICTQNRDGIHLAYSGDNSVTNCACSVNQLHGIVIYTASITGNEVLWNDFSSNDLENAYDSSNSTRFEYNYYSDYTGTDTDNDGYGDTPYLLPGIAANQDPHPLITPLNRQPGLGDSTDYLTTSQSLVFAFKMVLCTITVLFVISWFRLSSKNEPPFTELSGDPLGRKERNRKRNTRSINKMCDLLCDPRV